MDQKTLFQFIFVDIAVEWKPKQVIFTKLFHLFLLGTRTEYGESKTP